VCCRWLKAHVEALDTYKYSPQTFGPAHDVVGCASRVFAVGAVPTWAHSRLQIALMFTHDKGVVETVAALCGWVAIVVVGDGLNAVYSGQSCLVSHQQCPQAPAVVMPGANMFC
jgi:hypothetical protein